MPPHGDRAPELPSLEWHPEDGTLVGTGDWTWHGLSGRRPGLPWRIRGPLRLDTTAVTAMDTAGALLLHRHLHTLASRNCTVDQSGVTPAHARLMDLVARHEASAFERPRAANPLHRLGNATVSLIARLLAFFGFVGAVAHDGLPRLLRPMSIRWRQVGGEIQHAGVNALPILGLLVFLTGVVIAYQGGAPLQQYGANIFLVDLLSLTILREMAPLMTAIIVAGRTGSAYTAQIGTMQITEEVDALRVIGITPYEMLVLPKLIALFISMPLLTLFADIVGMAGGITVSATWFGIGVGDFLQRMPDAIAASSFWVGIAKAPVFAVLIVTVSCYHGFCVQGSTESVGRATTQSVVQGIFLVIVADALFSIAFTFLDL
ncbi:MAG: ABC transporter permease [Ectothiorhodospiraceae bacterium]